MKRIIITGATSMIGIALTEVAIKNGVEVFALVRPSTNRRERIIISPLVHVIDTSLEDLDKVRLDSKCDVFYHFAWAGTNKVMRDDPLLQEKNIYDTLKAVELALRCGCDRFVGAGSQAEYGFIDGVIDEKTKFSPVTSYGISKYAAGLLSKKLCEKKGLQHVWARIFSVYGSRDNDETMLNYAINCWEQGKVAKFSSATQSWNYLYETDAGEIFYRLGLDYVPSDFYFVAHPESQTLRKYIDVLVKAYGERANVEFTSAKSYGLNVNMQKTMSVLKYMPQINFEEGINKMLRARLHSVGGGTA